MRKLPRGLCSSVRMSKEQMVAVEILLTKKQMEMIELKFSEQMKERKIAELECKVLALEKEKADFVEARRQLMQCWEYKDGVVGLKRLGEIDVVLLQKAIGSKFLFSDDDPVVKIEEVCSFWQNKISDPNWHPFKLVPVSDQEHQVQVNIWKNTPRNC